MSRDKEENYRLSKSERIKSRKSVNRLFSHGRSFLVHPFKVVWYAEEFDTGPRARMAVSVSKRYSKRAVHRNRIRRKIKEAYRLHKNQLYHQLSETNVRLIFMYIYVGREEYEWEKIEHKIIVSLKRLFEEYAKGDECDFNRVG
jgi:ribonuclease P protein component